MAGSPTPVFPPSAAQPDPTTALQAGQQPIDPSAIASLGALLNGRFKQYEWDRRMAELGWVRNARQFLGIYDPEIEMNMDRNRSKAYPKLTRVKCVSMLSRLMNLLFPSDDKNWSVGPSACPELDQKDLQTLLDTLYPPPTPGSDLTPLAAAMPSGVTPPPGAQPAPLDNEKIESAILAFATKRARRMELEIEDQLQELGGARTASYVSLCRKVLASGVQYGAGVLKGPFVEQQEGRDWVRDQQGNVIAQTVTKYRPRFEFVPIWDYYPDMSAKSLHQMDGQFERIVLTRHQLMKLKERSDFLPTQIDQVLRNHPTGNYVRRAYETDLLSEGPQINSASQGMGTTKNKFEIYVWEGHITGRELAAAGNVVAEANMNDDVKSNVWTCAGIVIKCQLSPWTLLTDADSMCMYHHFIFEENETFLLGNGLPNIVRDSQLSLCAVVRMAIDNASIQRNIEVNQELLDPNQDVSSFEPDKVWIRRDENVSQTGNMPAVRPIDLPMHLEELQSLAQMFQGFADTETFVNPATGGDMQRGPSEPYRTASGASMLQGAAALPFKDVVRSFDCFTESVINAILIFNKVFNPNPDLNGDFRPIARGATSLIAKEVLGSQLDQLATTLTPEERQYMKPLQLLRARLRVRDLDVTQIAMNDDEAAAVDQQTAAQASAKQASDAQMIAAQVREILSNALKNIAQAGKNTAAANADTANVILNALDKGLDPDALTPQGAADGSSQGGPANSGSPGSSSGAPQPSNVIPLGAGPASAQAALGAASGQGAGANAAMPA